MSVLNLVGGLAVLPKKSTGHKFEKSALGKAITDSLAFINSPINYLQLCYGHFLLWHSSMGHIGVNFSLETCSNDLNSTVCYLLLCHLECTNHPAISSLKHCVIVSFYACITLY